MSDLAQCLGVGEGPLEKNPGVLRPQMDKLLGKRAVLMTAHMN